MTSRRRGGRGAACAGHSEAQEAGKEERDARSGDGERGADPSGRGEEEEETKMLLAGVTCVAELGLWRQMEEPVSPEALVVLLLRPKTR